MTAQLYREVTATLVQAGRQDLVAQLEKELAGTPPKETLTSGEAAEMLGLSSPNTVKNWLAGGYFPGSFQTKGGHWRFPRADVEAVRHRIEELRERNRRGDVSPSEAEEEDSAPPLL